MIEENSLKSGGQITTFRYLAKILAKIPLKFSSFKFKIKGYNRLLKILGNDSNEIIWIKAFKNGDKRAFEMLFAKYHKKLYSYIFNMIRSKEETEEIVQDAFVKIWEKREFYNEEYPFNAFLFKIAKNAFLNVIRKNVNHKIVEEQWDIILDVHVRPADEYVIFKETTDILDSIIDQLPTKRKEIFKLRRMEELSRAEIADKLGISIITVDSQLMKAYRTIREQLRKHDVLFIIVCASMSLGQLFNLASYFLR